MSTSVLATGRGAGPATAGRPARSRLGIGWIGRPLAGWGLATALCALAAAPLTDADGWWHLATGRLIAATGAVPATDPFSWAAAGQPWANTEWAANGLFWLAYAAGGLAGARLLAAALAGLALVGAYHLARLRGGSPAGAGITAAVIAAGVAPLTSIRPQVFTWALLVAVALLVEGAIRREAGFQRLWLLLPLGWIWAQLHGAYLYGVGLVGLYAVGALGAAVRDGASTASSGRVWAGRGGLLLGLAAGMEALAGLSPAGAAWWAYPFAGVSSPSSNGAISEWQSPNFHLDGYAPLLLLLLALIAALGATARALAWPAAGAWTTAWLTALRRTAPGVAGPLAWVLLGGGLGATLYQQRHAPLLFLLGGPLLAPLVDSGLALLPAFPRPALLRPLGVLAAAGVIAGGVAATVVPPPDAGFYPVAALADPQVQALVRDPQHRLWNYYTWGGYLIWQRVPVAVDGRQYVYGESWMALYVDVIRLAPGWQVTLRREGVDLVLFPTGAPLTGALAGRPDWRIVYQDATATLYQRVGPATPEREGGPGDE